MTRAVCPDGSQMTAWAKKLLLPATETQKRESQALYLNLNIDSEV